MQTIMNQLPIHTYLPNTSRLIFGCMGLGGNTDPALAIQQAHQAIDAALEAGINFFDHADIYASGRAELVFGEVLKQRPELRAQIYLQTKCGIRFADSMGPQRYDFSRAWILNSVEGSLARLGVEQLDILELHRPDPLMEPEEVAEAFALLKSSGKVKHFGVSNMTAAQLRFLQSYLAEPLVANQLELSLAQHSFVDEGIFGLHPEGAAVNFAAGTLEYCRSESVQLQAWGSLAQGLFSGKDVSAEPAHIQQTAQLVTELAEEHGVSREAVVLAWLMRHPAQIQPVIGTTNPSRIHACAQALKVSLTREQWYRLYVSARGQRLL
jgi:predicted oxidoreductase